MLPILIGDIKPLALVLCFLLVSLPEIRPEVTAEHQWLPVRHARQQQGHHSTWSARQLLYSVRMRVKGGKGTQIANAERAGLERSAWESRLPIFVIGLKHREEERLAPFLLKLRWYEDLHVVEAVDGRTLEPTDRMTSGEIGCFESHRKAWKQVVDEELRQAIVMEDDADVDMSVHMKDVAAFVSDAPPDWQILYLGINNDKDIRNVTAIVAEPLHYIMGTHAYVIRGTVAARLHALSETPPYKDTYKPVDMWLTEQGLKIYVINPPLVKQRNFGDTDTQRIRTKTINATRLHL